MAEVSPDPAAFDLAAAVADRRWLVEQRQRILAEQQQSRIDAELRATRRALVEAARRRGATRAVGFLDEDFLAVADRRALFKAIIDAAVTTGGAACADLQLYDDAGGVLRIAAQRGFSSQFLAFFATVDSTAPSACAVALATEAAVLVDDVSRSPIFAGQPSRDVVLAAGTRAVYSYPLITPVGHLLGVFSLHRPKPADRPDNAAFVAHCAAQALIQTSRAPVGPR